MKTNRDHARSMGSAREYTDSVERDPDRRVGHDTDGYRRRGHWHAISLQ